MSHQRILAAVLIVVLIVSQLLIPGITFPSPARADVGWTKHVSNPVFTRDAISGASAVIYDSSGSIYKMWYTQGVFNIPTIDGFISNILGLGLGNLITDLTGADYAAVANNDAGAIKTIIDYLASLSTAQLSNLLDGTGSVVSYATSIDGFTWQYQSDVLAGTVAAWDSLLVGSPSVIKTGSTYEMWYTGGQTDFTKIKTFFADLSLLTADDLKTVLNDLVNQNIAAFFADARAARGDAYLITLVGDISNLMTSTNLAIGHATSTDGITWIKDSANPVVTRGDSTAWDRFGAATPSVIKSGSTYEMWYAGFNLDFNQLLALLVANNIGDVDTALLAGVKVAIGHATSSDGSTWTKDPSNPVLQKGVAGDWDSYGVFAPSVIKNSGGDYEIWYTGAKIVPGSLISFLNHTETLNGALLDGTSLAIGHAASPNGTSWTKDIANPVLTRGAGDAWDKYGVGFPSVIKVCSSTLMWYTGIKMDPRAAIIGLLTGGGLNSVFAVSQTAIGHAYYNTPRILQSITVSPSSASVAVGKTLQFTATAHYSDGCDENITSSSGISWMSSDTGKAVINGTGLATGLVTGQISITASRGGLTSDPDPLTIVPKVDSITPAGLAVMVFIIACLMVIRRRKCVT